MYSKLASTIVFFLCSIPLASAQAVQKIGDNNYAIDASAVLEIESTTKGFLPPRMTTAQRNAIVSPVAGLTVYNTDKNCWEWYNGTVWFNGCGNQDPSGSAICDGSAPTAIVPITSGTGKIWMDRNLGASRAATSSTDYMAYGCLYQWGRGNDGHASMNWTSGTAGTAVNGATATLSTTDTPANALFITINSGNYDWRSPQNDALWQVVGGINNPCPVGFRLPTDAELTAEVTQYSITNDATAYSSIHKFVLSGLRNYSDATLSNIGSSGYYWSSTVSGTYASNRYFNSSGAFSSNNFRAHGFSVRCLKD